MLLIHPPMAKPCEPPAGIPRLAGMLRGHNLPCTVVDANLEAILYLIDKAKEPDDTWSRRARRNRAANLQALRTPKLYTNPARYQRAVADINRVLEMAGQAQHISLSLANYQDPRLSPLKSDDLLHAAATAETNIFYPYFSERLGQLLEATNPTMIGLSLNFLSQAITTFAMLGFLRQHYPNLTIVVGGGLVTSWCSHPWWRHPFAGLIDHLIAGPGEAPLLALLGQPDACGHHPPDFSDLEHNDYFAPGLILPYGASSGCYWNQCSFCPEPAEGNPYLPQPVYRVMLDIHALATRTKPVLLHLLDNAISPALMQAIADEPPDVSWYSFARVSRRLTDPDFCRALRSSGCVMLKLGIESGDQEVLDAMHKGIDLAMVSRALTALRQAGIATYVYLLFGTPDETIDAARRTLAFVVRHHRAITFLNLAIFNLPVNALLTDTLVRKEFFPGDLSLYTDFEHPGGWQRHEVRRFLDQEFKRHPAIAAILRRDPPIFTSNHAPFFCNPVAT